MNAAYGLEPPSQTPHELREYSQAQKPGGLTRWLTLVHFGTSEYTRTHQHSI